MYKTKPSQQVIFTQNLCKAYGMGDSKVQAVNDISITIPKKKFSVFIGPSGCGKTTLMNLFGAIDIPNSGKLEVAGTNILKMSDSQLASFRSGSIGFIFQNFNLIPVMNVFDNVAYPLYLNHTPKDTVKERVESTLKSIEIEHLKKKKPNQLSGGQRQRVAIARALINNPAVVLADEPTANLDSKTSVVILDLMRSLCNKNKTTFIFSTHDNLVIDYADIIYKMKDGKIINIKEVK